MSVKHTRVVRLKSTSYQMGQGNLFRKHHLGMLRRCLEYDESQSVLKDLHDGRVGGHYVGSNTAHKIMWNSSNYFPQGNGLAESTNKSLISILNKTLPSHQRNWHNALSNGLWASRVTPKPSIGTFPYFLVYGKEAILPPNQNLLALRLAQESQGSPCLAIQSRIDTLVRFEDGRLKTKDKISIHQAWINKWFDKKYAGSYEFNLGDMVLKWDRAHEDKGKHTKFQSLWIGAFQIKEKIFQHTFKLQTLGG
eukprot:PITA_25871